MRKILTLGLIGLMIFSCSKDEIQTPNDAVNSADVNLSIGIEKDADLNLVLNTLNELKFDIRQMNGFAYNGNPAENSDYTLIEILNQKSYINVGGWGATQYNVYLDPIGNTIKIFNTFFNMTLENQQDLLSLLSTLHLEDDLSETKSMYLSVPVGSEAYWKTQMMTYPFVKWAETFDDFCISYEHATVSFEDFPSTGNTNQVIPIPITFQIVNGCGAFGNIQETNSGTNKTLKVYAKYEGCVCTEIMGEVQTTYNFIATTTGVHTIKFLQPSGEFLTFTINIQ